MRTISVKQAQKFDQDAQKKLGLPSIILMENAGRHVAQEALKMLGKKKNVLVVCGAGNNGGDGLVAARHLLNAGIKVGVLMAGKPAKLKSDPKINYNILKRMGTAKFIRRFSGRYDLIIDSLFGIGLKSEVRRPHAEIIDQMNAGKRPILAVDVPSGLDADTGAVMGGAVKAGRTVTFVAPKKGFFLKQGPACCGRIVVRDIGILK